MKIEYSTHGGNYKHPIEIKWFDEDCLTENHEIDSAINECAEDYHENHDGWEVTWPVVITLFVDDEEVGRREVSREYEPVFSCN